jgi:hypothetical protein
MTARDFESGIGAQRIEIIAVLVAIGLPAIALLLCPLNESVDPFNRRRSDLVRFWS